jgi:glycine C-acetyltransferase
MSEKLAFLRQTVNELKEKKLDWRHFILESASVPHCKVNGKEVLMLCSNNYLGLANHPKLKEAAIKATQEYGVGSGSVPAIAGTMDLMIELEEKLARFKETEATLVCQTGFATSAGLIPQLIGKNDLVISDQLNHGCIIDGIRLSKAEKAIYSHLNMEELEKILKENKGKFEKILIVTDGVFSMDGDIAPLDRISELAQQFDAISYVDDAHGDGVMGEQGKGTAHHFKVKLDIETGTFSKAFGTFGGYVAGSHDLKEFTLNKSRTWLLSASHPPGVTAATIAALEVIQSEPQHLKNLWDNTKYFKKELQSLGFDTGISQTPITPVIVGESSVAQELSKRLFEEGVFALPIVYPMVAKDKARIRTMMNAALTKDDLNFALEKFEKIGRELKII